MEVLWPQGLVRWYLTCSVQCNVFIAALLWFCGMQKQSKGKAARTLANLAGFESLSKMAEEPWYDAIASCLLTYSPLFSVADVLASFILASE